MQEKIIDFLKKKQGYLSGDYISCRLGITRQALWKHIQELKDNGYDIAAVPHLGYKLISLPDRLFTFEVTRDLNTQFIGKRIHYFDSLASTMDMAMQLGMKRAPEGTLVLAEYQTRGRGRLGRDWSSPRYKGIYLSLILRPKMLPQRASILTLLCAVSIWEAIQAITGIDTQIKWPNDILIDNMKLGGILTELIASTDEIKFMVVGIGLNINNDKKSLVPQATSLKEKKGEMISRVRLLQEILRKIECNYLIFQQKGAGLFIEKWRKQSVTLGKRVKVQCHKKVIEGVAQDIDTDGGLLIRNDSGMIQKIMAGDVVHSR
ncbi:MAG: biotin--[acetyl-CoA-carboxylase] ligase [Candidatus Omnitrophota bacterium]